MDAPNKFQALVLGAMLLATPLFAEKGGDHEPGTAPEQGPSTALASPGLTRKEALAQGLREAGLSPQALKIVEREFRRTPRVDAKTFDKVIARVNSENKGLITSSQAEDLRRLFKENLDGVNGETGVELSEAAREALQATTASSEEGAPIRGTETKSVDGAKGAKPGENISPETLNNLMKTLGAQFGRGGSAGDLAALDGAGGALGEAGLFGAIRGLLGKDKDGAGGREDRLPEGGPPPGFPRPGEFGGRPPGGPDRGRDEDKGNKHDTPPPREQKSFNFPTPPSGSGGNNKNDSKGPEQASGPSDPPRRKIKDEEELPKPEKDPLAGITPKESVLDVDPPKPPPQVTGLPPMGPAGGSAGGFDPSAFGGGGFGGGMGAGMGMGAGGGMMPAGGGGGSFGGGGEDSGQLFASVGGGGGYGDMPPGGSYSIAKDGGYGGSGGGGSSYESDSGGDDDGMDLGDYAAPNVAGRVPSFAEQIDMTVRADETAGNFLLARQKNFLAKNLCSSDYSRAIGICQTMIERQRNADNWRNLQ